jgi:hypothetical protein
VTLQFWASLTDDTWSVNYDHNTFIIQATGAAQIDTKLASLLAIFKNRLLIKRNSFLKKFWDRRSERLIFWEFSKKAKEAKKESDSMPLRGTEDAKPIFVEIN